MPRTTLHICHRQDETAKALAHNVHNFRDCHCMDDLHYDDSFTFIPTADDNETLSWVREQGTALYLADPDVQVLSPVRTKGVLSVATLNWELQELVNPVVG